MVNTPAPTLVPKELATSFAPIPNASINAMIKPRTTIHKIESEYGNMIDEILDVLGFDEQFCK